MKELLYLVNGRIIQMRRVTNTYIFFCVKVPKPEWSTSFKQIFSTCWIQKPPFKSLDWRIGIFQKLWTDYFFFPVLDSNIIDFEFSIKRSKILLLSTTIFSLDILCCSPYYLCSSKIKKLRLISRKNCPSSSLHK